MYTHKCSFGNSTWMSNRPQNEHLKKCDSWFPSENLFHRLPAPPSPSFSVSGNDATIHSVTQTKIPGLIFDSFLSFPSHHMYHISKFCDPTSRTYPDSVCCPRIYSDPVCCQNHHCHLGLSHHHLCPNYPPCFPSGIYNHNSDARGLFKDISRTCHSHT